MVEHSIYHEEKNGILELFLEVFLEVDLNKLVAPIYVLHVLLMLVLMLLYLVMRHMYQYGVEKGCMLYKGNMHVQLQLVFQFLLAHTLI